MNIKVLKAATITMCIAFAGCSGGTKSAEVPATVAQTHTRAVADVLHFIAGDNTNCNGSSSSTSTTASSANVSALPGNVSALPGNVSALPGQFNACSQTGNDPIHITQFFGGTHSSPKNCAAPVKPHGVLCTSSIRNDISAIAMMFGDAGLIPGLHPSDITEAYNLPISQGIGQKVALVDAYDDPNAESDLAAYRKEFGLTACTTANGCFKKMGTGSNPATLPAPNTNWASEIAIDLDMVSAACPNCKILLVEASSDALADLATGVDVAAASGATVINNSFYVPESTLQSDDIANTPAHYAHPGIPIVVSSGDQSVVTYPASLPNVIAVGGTTLTKTTVGARGWYETAWGSSGSGCSTVITAAPAWQKATGCTARSTADVSMVADPDTGVATYNTYNATGWYVAGGTSVSAPLVAAVIALAEDGSTLSGASKEYSISSGLYPVDAGVNGTCTKATCAPASGYQAMTGMGTPNGTASF